MAVEVIVSQAADWTEEEADRNLKYLDTRGRIHDLQEALKLRGMTWDEFTSVPAPENFPQPEGGDRGNQAPDSGVTVVEPSGTSSAVPDGTVDDVLEWVDDDPARAALALEAERAGKERVSLIEALEDIAEEGEE